MNTSSLTLQQRMEILTRDFLERDGNSFVKIRRTGRLGWEDTLPHDGAYSSYILESCSQEELISRAYQLACNMITVMDSDRKVTVKITSDQSATDSNVVWVATKVFDEPGLTTGQKLDAFLGFAIHEGCHLLYTDFPVLSQASCRTAEYTRRRPERPANSRGKGRRRTQQYTRLIEYGGAYNVVCVRLEVSISEPARCRDFCKQKLEGHLRAARVWDGVPIINAVVPDN